MLMSVLFNYLIKTRTLGTLNIFWPDHGTSSKGLGLCAKMSARPTYSKHRRYFIQRQNCQTAGGSRHLVDECQRRWSHPVSPLRKIRGSSKSLAFILWPAWRPAQNSVKCCNISVSTREWLTWCCFICLIHLQKPHINLIQLCNTLYLQRDNTYNLISL